MNHIDEAVRHFAWVDGRERPNSAWIEHPSFMDYWVPNPHYRGDPMPSPMDDDGWREIEQTGRYTPPGKCVINTDPSIYASEDNEIPF